MQMHSAMQRAATSGILNSLFGSGTGDTSQFVTIEVSRSNLVSDTFEQIAKYCTQDLKKPLKVKFQNEEAEDAGGVRKEFFMLLIKELLDPKYGMFTEFTDSRCIWFSEHSFEEDEMYYLIGVICGLAIYNFTIVNVPFPLALYKKLLHENVDLNDLVELSPVVVKSLKSLLDYEGDDFEDTFCLTFEVSREVFGEVKSFVLKPDGENIPVTLANRQEYIDLYVDYILNKSIEQPFNHFYRGFMRVI